MHNLELVKVVNQERVGDDHVSWSCASVGSREVATLKWWTVMF